MKNKLILPLCALASVLCAKAYDINQGGVFYDIIDAISVAVTYQNTDYNCYRGSVEIPSKVSNNGVNYTVTTIGENAFKNCTNALEVTLPSTIETISNNAFYEASGLTSITMPSATTIGNYAFYNCQALQSIDLPKNLETIGDFAFTYCSSIPEVSYPASLTSIGDRAFSQMPLLTKVVIEDGNTTLSIRCYSQGWNYYYQFQNAPIEEVYVGRNITYDISPFTHSTIQKLTIGRGMTAIPNGFMPNAAIKTLDIPSNITSIGSSAFNGCTNLRRITIGANVLSIGGSAFPTSKVAKVYLLPNTVPDGVANLYARQMYVANDSYASQVYPDNLVTYKLLSSMFTVDGVTYVPTSFSARTCDAIDCTYDPDVTEINIGATVNYEGVTMNVDAICDYALYWNPYITSVNVSNRRQVGAHAFNTCTALRSVEVSNTDYIGDYAFYNCSNLQSVVVANQGYIGEYAFDNNNALASVIVNEPTTDIKAHAFENSLRAFAESSVTLNNIGYIGAYAFQNCSGIKTLNISSNVGDIQDCAFRDSFTSSTEGTAILNNRGTLGDYAFSGCTNLIGATLSEDITSIGEYCFNNCTSLHQVNIPACIEEIKTYTFYNTTALEHIDLPEGLLTIQVSAFDHSGLVDLYIPASTTNIAEKSFWYCQNLNYLHFNDSEEELSVGIGSYGSVGNGMFYHSPLDNLYIGRQLTYRTESNYGYSPFANGQVKHVEFGDIPARIASAMFYGCGNLESAHLGLSLQIISSHAFRNCTALTDVNVPEGNTLIDTYTFYNCSSLQHILLPETLETIEQYAFSGSGLLSITIPAATTAIKDYVFERCTDLALFVTDDAATTLSLGHNGSNGMFHDCHLEKVINGRYLSYYISANSGYSPFYRNAYLREVIFTDVPIAVTTNEFYGCTALTDVTIGDGVTSIGNYAFSGCTSLTNFLFGESVATIGDEAFSDCTAMVKLYAQAQMPPTCGSQALDDINKWRCTLYIPNGSYDQYVSAPQWMEFLKVANTNVETGDANADGRVTVADVSTVVDHVLGYEPLIDLTAADANQDGQVLISDATAIVRMILGTWQAASYAPAQPALTGCEHIYQLRFDNICGGVSAQMDITVPEGMVLTAVEMAGDNALTHRASFSMIDPTHARIVVVSLDNDEFADATLLDITMDGESFDRPEALQAYLVSREDGLLIESEVAAHVDSVEGSTSAIANINGSDLSISVDGQSMNITSATARTITITDMQGRSTTVDIHSGENAVALQASGIYIVDGQKIAVK